jgi:hypothetical protein
LLNLLAPHEHHDDSQARKLVANILRTVADSASPGAIAASPALARFFAEWGRDAAAFLGSSPLFGEGFWESCQVGRGRGQGA